MKPIKDKILKISDDKTVLNYNPNRLIMKVNSSAYDK